MDKGNCLETCIHQGLLAWDYESHMTEDVNICFRENNIKSVIVCGGFIKYIHASDFFWNKPFKQRVAELYDKWWRNGVHEIRESSKIEEE